MTAITADISATAVRLELNLSVQRMLHPTSSHSCSNDACMLELTHVQKVHGSRARDPLDFSMAEIHRVNLRMFRVTLLCKFRVTPTLLYA